MKGTCTVDGCERGLLARGLCRSHYEKARRSGEMALLVMPTPAERLAAGLVRMPNGCLEWTGLTNDKGYGLIHAGGKNVSTHRLAWELANGPIPDGMCVLHHCDNPPCCDAEKCLFLGTKADNNADMAAKGRASYGDWQRATTHCPQGHEYDEANTYVNPKGSRVCRTCTREAGVRHDAVRRPTRPLTERTHCQRGHPFNEANTYITKKGSRSCRECGRASTARYLARLKSA